MPRSGGHLWLPYRPASSRMFRGGSEVITWFGFVAPGGKMPPDTAGRMPATTNSWHCVDAFLLLGRELFGPETFAFEPLQIETIRAPAGRSCLFPQVPPEQGVQPGRRKDGDDPALDGEEFLFAEFSQRARKCFAHRSQFRREHTLGQG